MPFSKLRSESTTNNETMRVDDLNEPRSVFKRNSISSRLMRSILKNIKRLSAPGSRRSHTHAPNHLANRENEHTKSGENTSSYGWQGLAKADSIESRIDLVVPPRSSSVPHVKPSAVKHRFISAPIVPARTSSIILRHYSSTQLRDVRTISKAEEERDDDSTSSSSNGEQKLSFESDRPATTKNATNPSTPLTPISNMNDNGPQQHPPIDLGAVKPTHSPGEYISPRSQWTVPIASLMVKEKQPPAIEDTSRGTITFINHITVTRKRRIRACDSPLPSNTTTDYSEFSILRPDFTEDTKLIAEPQCISGLLFEETRDIHQPAYLMMYPADRYQMSWNSQLSETSSVYSENGYTTDKDAEASRPKL
jgi:hypothetical protein